MSVSLNETAAMAKRATRGAGYPWGLAEEAAWSVRWLCAHGQDGVAALAMLLARGFGDNLDAHRPVHPNGLWQGEAALCPLATGAALSDHAHLLGSAPLSIRSLAAPVLIVPFAALAARRIGGVVVLHSETASAAVNGTSLEMRGTFGAQTADLRLRRGAGMVCVGPTCTRATPRPADWDSLNTLAHRTYAPASEESRRLGAGAGETDND